MLMAKDSESLYPVPSGGYPLSFCVFHLLISYAMESMDVELLRLIIYH